MDGSAQIRLSDARYWSLMIGMGVAEATDAKTTAATAELAPPGRPRRALARSIYGDLVQIVDFLSVIVAASVIAGVYVGGLIDVDSATSTDIQRYVAAGILGATVVTTLLRRDGYYEFNRLISSRHAPRAIVSRWTATIVGLIAFSFAIKNSEDFSRVWLLAWYLSAASAMVTTRYMCAYLLRREAGENGALARRIAVIGGSQAAHDFAELVRRTEAAAKIIGIFETDPNGAQGRSFDLSGDLEVLARLARRGDIDDIVIASSAASEREVDALVNRLSILPVSVSICACPDWLRHTGGEMARIGAAPVLNLYRRPLEGWGGFIKTVEDRALAAAALMALSPVLLVIAVAIMLQGKGPVLFSQQRHGFNHSVFRIYKFRTMTVAEDGEDVVQATRQDPRVTPLGKILRRYSLDELPQLFNVLKGDMSLVGPRPHALAHNHDYAQKIENYSGRHKVKPGITGWAQVNGCRGETSETEHMAERVRYDLEYIDNWSLYFDIKILAMTVFAVLSPKNAH